MNSCLNLPNEYQKDNFLNMVKNNSLKPKAALQTPEYFTKSKISPLLFYTEIRLRVSETQNRIGKKERILLLTDDCIFYLKFTHTQNQLKNNW